MIGVILTTLLLINLTLGTSGMNTQEQCIEDDQILPMNDNSSTIFYVGGELDYSIV